MSRKSNDNERYFSISLIELLSLIKKNILMIVISCTLCGGIVYVVNEYIIQPTYEATATMSVITRNEDTVNITNDQITSAENLVDTYAVVIQSKKVLQQVIDQLGLGITYNSLKNRVSVKSVNGTQIMEITVKSTDSQLAKSILAEIVSIAPEEIINAIGAGAVRIIDEAECSNKKVEPHTFLNVLVSVFLCVVILLAIIVIRFIMNDTYYNEENLQDDLEIPVLGVIPVMDSNNFERKNTRRKKLNRRIR